MKKSKTIAYLMAVILCVSMISACGQSSTGSPQSTADSSKPVEKSEASSSGGTQEVKSFTIYYGDSNAVPISYFDTPIGKKITEITGYRAEYEFIVGNDETTKVGVMIASGDYPDIVNGHERHRQFVEAGAVIPIEDLIEKYGENTKKLYDANRLRRGTYDDGHNYFIPPTKDETPSIWAASGTHIQIAVLEDAGWPEVKDFDQYTDLIRNYIKKYPEINGKPTIGFTSSTDEWRFFTVFNGPARLAGHPNDADAIVDPVTYEARKFYTSPETLAYCEKLNLMWNEGLIDPEMFAQDYDTYLSKISEGRVLGFLEPRWQIEQAEDSLRAQGLHDRMHVSVPATIGGVEDSFNIPTYMFIRDGLSISVNCKDPDEAFKFMDAMMDEEVLKLRYWGIEGEDYYVENGKFMRTAEQWARASDPDYKKQQGLDLGYAFGSPPQDYQVQGNCIEPRDTQEFKEGSYTDAEKKVLDAYGIKTLIELLAPAKPMPWGEVWSLELPQDNVAVQDQVLLQDIQRRYLPQLVMSPPDQFDSLWVQYVAEIDQHKDTIAELERLINEAIQKAVDKNKPQ